MQFNWKLEYTDIFRPRKFHEFFCADSQENKFLYKIVYEFYHFIIYHQQQHHNAVPLARISMTLSYDSSLLSIASGRSYMIHFLSLQSCCRYVLAGHLNLARPWEVSHGSTSFLLLQIYPSCLVRRILMVLEEGGRWPYSCSFVEFCH